VKSSDPARMPAHERVAELGELLAAGAQRLLARKVKPIEATNERTNPPEQLDVVPAVEAPCRSPTQVPA